MNAKKKAGAAGHAAALPAAAEARVPSIINVPTVLGWLGARALRNATEEDLATFAGLAAEAQAIAQRGAAVANGIACLVREDSNELGAGSFRDSGDVAGLLLHLGDVFGLVAGLMNISELAEDSLRRRTAMAKVQK